MVAEPDGPHIVKNHRTIFFSGFHPKFFGFRHKPLANGIGPGIKMGQAG
jgi:hypothetical protein